MKKKMLALFAILMLGVVTLTACGSNIDERLVGTWIWDANSNYQLILEEDGTGRWIGVQDDIEWSIRGGDLRLDSDDYRSTWEFDFNESESELTIDRSDDYEGSFTYINTEDISEFVGIWAWDVDSSFQLIFEANGTGQWIGVVDSFEWEYVSGELILTVNGLVDIWSAVIEGDSFILTSLQEDDVEWTYIRQ